MRREGGRGHWRMVEGRAGGRAFLVRCAVLCCVVNGACGDDDDGDGDDAGGGWHCGRGGEVERRKRFDGVVLFVVRESRCVCAFVCVWRACFTSSPRVGMLCGLMGPLCVSEWTDGAWIRCAVDGWIDR